MQEVELGQASGPRLQQHHRAARVDRSLPLIGAPRASQAYDKDESGQIEFKE